MHTCHPGTHKKFAYIIWYRAIYKQKPKHTVIVPGDWITSRDLAETCIQSPTRVGYSWRDCVDSAVESVKVKTKGLCSYFPSTMIEINNVKRALTKLIADEATTSVGTSPFAKASLSVGVHSTVWSAQT